MQCSQAVRVLHEFKIAVNDEFAVRPPHHAIEVPRNFPVLYAIIIWIGVDLIQIGEVAFAPSRFHIIFRISILFVILSLAVQSRLFHGQNLVSRLGWHRAQLLLKPAFLFVVLLNRVAKDKGLGFFLELSPYRRRSTPSLGIPEEMILP